MARIYAEQAKVYDGWGQWAAKLGWSIHSCEEDYAYVEFRPGAKVVRIPLQARMDIERTWRELEQSNVAPIRSGTDG